MHSFPVGTIEHWIAELCFHSSTHSLNNVPGGQVECPHFSGKLCLNTRKILTQPLWFFRVPEDCYCHRHRLRDNGLHWILRQAHPHPHQQHHRGVITWAWMDWLSRAKGERVKTKQLNLNSWYKNSLLALWSLQLFVSHNNFTSWFLYLPPQIKFRVCKKFVYQRTSMREYIFHLI